MKRKTILLFAAALSALAFAALPAVAAASVGPTIDLPHYPTTFSGSSTEEAILYEETSPGVRCKTEGETPALTIHGNVTGPHEGSATFTFHGCKETKLNSKCTSPGAEAGTIETTTLPFHTVYLANGKPGVLFEPNQENTVEEKHWFAHFTCVGGLVKVTVGGNGVLGTVTEPTIGGEVSNSFKVDVSAPGGAQQHTTVLTGTDENGDPIYQSFGLQAKKGSTTKPAAEDVGPATAHFTESLTGKTTTETVE